MSYFIKTIRGTRVHTTELENTHSDTIECKDNLNMNDHNIDNVSNINLSCINGAPYTTSFSSGKYSQVKGPGAYITVNGDNSNNETAISIINNSSDTGIGSVLFTPAELYKGSSYHVKIGGTYKTSTSKKIHFEALFGTTKIYQSKIYNDIDITDLDNKEYAYELEFDFTVHKEGSTGQIYSNGQLLYVDGSDSKLYKQLLGSSSEYETSSVDNINLASDVIFDIKINWENGATSNEVLTNKMVRITKMF